LFDIHNTVRISRRPGSTVQWHNDEYAELRSFDTTVAISEVFSQHYLEIFRKVKVTRSFVFQVAVQKFKDQDI